MVVGVLFPEAGRILFTCSECSDSARRLLRDGGWLDCADSSMPRQSVICWVSVGSDTFDGAGEGRLVETVGVFCLV
jgi:hypothetical protein